VQAALEYLCEPHIGCIEHRVAIRLTFSISGRMSNREQIDDCERPVYDAGLDSVI